MIIHAFRCQAKMRIVIGVQFDFLLSLLLQVRLRQGNVSQLDFVALKPAVVPLVFVLKPDVVLIGIFGLQGEGRRVYIVQTRGTGKLTFNFQEAKLPSDRRLTNILAFIHRRVLGWMAST